MQFRFSIFSLITLLILSTAAFAEGESVTVTLRGFTMDGPASQNPKFSPDFIDYPQHFTQLQNLNELGILRTGELERTRVYIELWKRDTKKKLKGIFPDHKNLRNNLKKKDFKLVRVDDQLWDEENYGPLTLYTFINPKEIAELTFDLPLLGYKTKDPEKRKPEEEPIYNLTDGAYWIIVRFSPKGEKQPNTIKGALTSMQVYDYKLVTIKAENEDEEDEYDWAVNKRLYDLSFLLDPKTRKEYTSDDPEKEISFNIIFKNLREFLKTVPVLPDPGEIRDNPKDKNYVQDNTFTILKGLKGFGDTTTLDIPNGAVLVRMGTDVQIALGLVPAPPNFKEDPLLGNGNFTANWNDFPMSVEELIKKLDPAAAGGSQGVDGAAPPQGKKGGSGEDSLFAGVKTHFGKFGKELEAAMGQADMLIHIEKVAKISIALYKAVLDFLISKGTDVPDNVEDSFCKLTDDEIFTLETEISEKDYKTRLAAGEGVKRYGNEEDGYEYWATATTMVPEGFIGFEEAMTYDAALIKGELRSRWITKNDDGEIIHYNNIRIAKVEDDKYCNENVPVTKRSYPIEWDDEGTPTEWASATHNNCMPNWELAELRHLMIGKTLKSPPEVNPFHIPINMTDKIRKGVHYYPGTIFLTHVGVAVIEFNDKGEKELWVYDAYPNDDGFGGIRRTTWAEFYGSTKHPLTQKDVVHASAGGIFAVPGRDQQGRLLGVEAAKQAQFTYRTWKNRKDEDKLAEVHADMVADWESRMVQFKEVYPDWYAEGQKEWEEKKDNMVPVVDDPFDYGFDWTTEWRQACSEFAWRAYGRIGVNIIPNLTMLRMPLQGVHKLGWEVVEKYLQASPLSIMISPRVERVADFLCHGHPEYTMVFPGDHEKNIKIVGNIIDQIAPNHKEYPVDISNIVINTGETSKRDGEEIIETIDLNELRVNGKPVFAIYPKNN